MMGKRLATKNCAKAIQSSRELFVAVLLLTTLVYLVLA